MAESHGRTARTMLMLAGITVVSRLLGFVREQFIAGLFGASALTDAYVAAQFLPNMLDSTLGAAFAVTMVPVFTAAKSKGRDQLDTAFSSALLGLGSFYAAETLLLWLASPLIIRTMVPGLDPQSLAKGVALTRLFAPLVFMLGVQGVYHSLSSVYKQFFFPALFSLSANVAVILTALAFWDRLTFNQLTWAILAGNVLQTALLVYASLRQATFRLRWPDWQILSEIWMLAFPLLVANGVARITPITDKWLGSQLNTGTISALNYAHMLVQVPVGVLVTGVAPVLFAWFAQLQVEQGEQAVTEKAARTLQALSFVTFPAMGLAVALAHPMVVLAYQRGQFGPEAAAATSSALAFFGYAIVPLVAVPVLGRILIALRDTRWQLLSGAVAVVAHLSTAILLRGEMGHRALALGYTLGRYSALAMLLVALARVAGGWRTVGQTLWSIRGTLLAALAAYGAARVGLALAPGPLAQFLLGGLLGLGAYVAVHLLLPLDEGQWIRAGLNKARSRLAQLIRKGLTLRGD